MTIATTEIISYLMTIVYSSKNSVNTLLMTDFLQENRVTYESVYKSTLNLVGF